MDLNEYYLLLIVLLGINLITNMKYKESYYIQMYWLITIPLYGVFAIQQNTSNEIFGVIIIGFSVMLNIFYLDTNYKQYKRVKNNR